MSEANKALARRLWDVWHSRDLDKLGDLIAEGHVNHDPNNPADLVGVEGYRELITLRDIEGWPPEDVCNVLMISVTNQRVLLHRARSHVRAALESHFNDR